MKWIITVEDVSCPLQIAIHSGHQSGQATQSTHLQINAISNGSTEALKALQHPAGNQALDHYQKVKSGEQYEQRLFPKMKRAPFLLSLYTFKAYYCLQSSNKGRERLKLGRTLEQVYCGCGMTSQFPPAKTMKSSLAYQSNFVS